MKTAVIADARSFSLTGISKNSLLETDDLDATLLCFEAGQRDEEGAHRSSTIYQVLEGEALVYQGESRERLGKGKVLAIPGAAPHRIENAGGGLLVVLMIRAR